MKRASAAVALSLCALASCRQIIGLDDRDATHDAGADVVVADTGPMIPPVTSADCPTEDAAFCDDFDDPTRDAGWVSVIDHPPENDGGPVGTIDIDSDGSASAPSSLRVRYVSFKSDNPDYRFNNARWLRAYPEAKSVELSFSFRIAAPTFPTNANDHQFALLTLPKAAVFPSIRPDGKLVFGWSTAADGGNIDYPSRESFVPLKFDTWQTMSIMVDSETRLILCKLDGQEAFRELYDATDTGEGFTIGIGQRTPFFGYTAAIEVRYDDVIVRTK